jgi:hypothetical protein
MILRGYFRFSKYVHRPSDLSAWASWFSGRGISCFIERRKPINPNGGFQHSFSLWRRGIEKVAPESEAKVEKPTGEIIWQGPDL